MTSQPAIALTFDSAIEVITPQLEKIQLANSGEALLNRPDKLRAHRVGEQRAPIHPAHQRLEDRLGGPVNRVGVR